MTQMETYNAIVNDVWKFFKKYLGDLPKTPDDWKALGDEAGNRFSKYVSTEYEDFTTSLYITAILEIEAITKQKLEGAKP